MFSKVYGKSGGYIIIVSFKVEDVRNECLGTTDKLLYEDILLIRRMYGCSKL